jgi:hypothetical protein
MNIAEEVVNLGSLDMCSDAYDAACLRIQQALGSRHYEQLYQLVMSGPVWDGDVISKSARSDLIDWGLASRVCVKGQQGFTGANYRGWNVLKSIPEDKKKAA